LQVGEIVGVGFGGAGGIEDADAGHAEASDGEDHGHAVVVIGFDGGGSEGVGWWGGDADPILAGLDGGAEFLQFGFEGGEAVGFFDAEVPDVADGGGGIGEEGDDGEGLDHVGDVVHVEVEAAELAVGRGGDGDSARLPFDFGAHLGQDIGEGDIALEAGFGEAGDGDGGAGDDGGGGEEVAGVGGVGFDGVRVVWGAIDARRDLDGPRRCLAALVVDLGVDAELLHHAEGHDDVGFAGDRAQEADGDGVLGVGSGHEDGGDVLGAFGVGELAAPSPYDLSVVDDGVGGKGPGDGSSLGGCQRRRTLEAGRTSWSMGRLAHSRDAVEDVGAGAEGGAWR